jgi:hypothetical protein
MLSCNSDTLGFKSFDCPVPNSKVSQLITLLKDPEVQSFLKTFIDAAIATSELKILKRLAATEQLLGIDCDEGTSQAPTIPQKIIEIEDKVNTLTNSFEPVLEPQMNLTTKTQRRACALVSKLRKCKKRFLTSSEIVHFLKNEVTEDLRIPENTCNPREIKKEVLEKAAELFPDIQLSKKSHGRKEVRIRIS